MLCWVHCGSGGIAMNNLFVHMAYKNVNRTKLSARIAVWIHASASYRTWVNNVAINLHNFSG